jgi:ankyrin repeat protein
MKIYKLMTLVFLINSMWAMEAPLNQKNAISQQLKNELVALLKTELSKSPADISRKSDFKLQQIVVACQVVLSNKVEVNNIAKTLKLTEKQVITALNRLLQRAQHYLDVSAKKKNQPLSAPVSKPIESVTPKKQLPVTILEQKPAHKISLWEAVNEGDLAAVEWHLANGTNVNSRSPGGESALALAAQRGDQAMVTRLIKAGADLNLRNINGHSALSFAMFQNRTPIVKELIAAGADVNSADHRGMTPLMEAAMHDNEQMVEYLMSVGANVYARDKYGQTASDLAQGSKYRQIRQLLDSQTSTNYFKKVDPKNKFIEKNGKKSPVLSLWQAAAQGDREIVNWHLNNGMDINAEDENLENALSLTFKNAHIPLMLELLQKGAKNPGETAQEIEPEENTRAVDIWEAAENGDIASGIWFINNGISKNAKNERGETPLIVAAHYDQTKVIEELISIKALLDEQDAQGNTALMRALEEKNIASAELLIDAGANLSSKNKEGHTALFIAASRGLDQIVSELLVIGANPNEKDEDNYTVLMLASYLYYRNANIIPSLIAAGADVNAQDDDGVTALMVAASRKSPKAVKQLLEAGARIDLQDVTGKTALDYAIASKHEETIKILTYATKLDKTKKALTLLPKSYDSPLKLPAREKVLGSTLPIAPIAEKKEKEVVLSAIKIPEPAAPTPPAAEKLRIIKIKKIEPVPASKVDNKEKDALLLKAVKKGKLSIIEQLIKQGADINAQNDKGETPLLTASRWGQTGIVKILLKLGANPNIAEESGLVPLQSAVMAGHIEIAKMLIDAGANVNAQDTMRKRTPINWVVRMTVGAVKKIAAQIPIDKSVLLLNLLLSNGANSAIPDYKNITPLTWARKMNFMPLVKILEKK